MAQRKTLAAILGTVAAAAALAFTGFNENGPKGTRNNPYRDSGGVWTVCTGQTGVTMKYYTDEQCDAMFANTLASYAAQIDAQMPEFAERTDGQRIAALDLAYNIGVHAFLWSGKRPSTISQLYRSNNFPAACDAFLNYKLVNGADCSVRTNNCYGIWQRRQAERSMCLGTVH
jgi:lysozyme